MQTVITSHRQKPSYLFVPNEKTHRIYVCTWCKKQAQEKEINPAFIIPSAIRVGKERQYICPNCLIKAVKEFGILIEGIITPQTVLEVLREEYAKINIHNDTESSRYRYLRNIADMIFGNPGVLHCKRTHW